MSVNAQQTHPEEPPQYATEFDMQLEQAGHELSQVAAALESPERQGEADEHEKTCATQLDRAWVGACDCSSTPPKAQAQDAWLFEHEDGRYAVAFGPGSPDFTRNEPKWHRLGPVEVVAALRASSPAEADEALMRQALDSLACFRLVDSRHISIEDRISADTTIIALRARLEISK